MLKKILIAILLICLIVLGLWVFSIFKSSIIENNTLVSDDVLETLQEDSLRLQIVSPEFPILVDSNNLIYLIPVGVKTLEKAEEIGADHEDEYSSSGESMRKSKIVVNYGLYFKQFNNLIIYNKKQDTTITLLNRRLTGRDLSIEYFKDETIMYFSAAETDSNKDGLIDYSDFQILYIYSFEKQKLTRLALEKATYIKKECVLDEKDLIISYGIDRNNDNKYEGASEPIVLMKYDYENEKFQKLIEDKTMVEIQKIIEKK